MKTFSLIAVSLLLLNASGSVAEGRLCMENICIGDDVDLLQLAWKKVNINYKTKHAVKGLLLDKTVDELYYDYNELLITDNKTKELLVPHIFQLQEFDQAVLDRLKKVKAICTPLSLTGEVENNSRTKLLITFRVVAADGSRGRLRVVQIEKEFNIFPPHVRPSDKVRYVSIVDTLKQDYPKMLLVRDIDARTTITSNEFSDAILGYRFFSDVYNPLILRLRDLADIESIEFDDSRSSLCPEVD